MIGAHITLPGSTRNRVAVNLWDAFDAEPCMLLPSEEGIRYERSRVFTRKMA